MAVADPTLEVEQQLWAAGAPAVIGMDEVGRGAMAGPVAVGASLLAPDCGPMPVGLRDSKMLSQAKRELLEPLTRAWAPFSAVGMASPAEVDELGITHCLALAAKRALAGLHELGADVASSTVLLDGHHDWLSPHLASPLTIVTRVKADRDCASVAAASVVAKVHRDALMAAAHESHPGYGWDGNKGYGSPAHMAAIAELGATELHRRSWIKQPGLF
ncbi:MAG: ribonuclease HII [Microbacteriaceae bacterium]